MAIVKLYGNHKSGEIDGCLWVFLSRERVGLIVNMAKNNPNEETVEEQTDYLDAIAELNEDGVSKDDPGDLAGDD